MQSRPCDRVFQVHSIAPLLMADRVAEFVRETVSEDPDVMLTCVHELIECAYEDTPVNFSFEEKTNSQELKPIQRITWSLTALRTATYMQAIEAGKTATYAGRVAFFPINRMEGHIIKTQEDLDIAEVLLAAAQKS